MVGMAELLVRKDKKGRFYCWSDRPTRKMYSVSTICHWNDEPIKAGDAAKIGTLGHYVVLNGIARKYLGVNLDIPGENPYWTDPEEVSQKLDDVFSGSCQCSYVVKNRSKPLFVFFFLDFSQ